MTEGVISTHMTTQFFRTLRGRQSKVLAHIAGVSDRTVQSWQVGLGALPMVLLGLVFERAALGWLDPLGWALLVYMTLVPMAACYVTWFATLRHLPPTTAATGMLLVPLIGVTSAALLLGEPFGLRQAVAMGLTFAGVALALRSG